MAVFNWCSVNILCQYLWILKIRPSSYPKWVNMSVFLVYFENEVTIRKLWKLRHYTMIFVFVSKIFNAELLFPVGIYPSRTINSLLTKVIKYNCSSWFIPGLADKAAEC